jgi:steroid 5-alpha reductase family enzyme
VFAIAVGLAFLIQWLVFIPSYLMQTEHFFDLTGSLTYITVASLAGFLSAPIDIRSLVLLALVVVWAARLGSFLFRRVRKSGKDDRFDEIKPSFVRFLNVWTLQGLWVTLTMAAALAAITSAKSVGLDLFAVIGLCVWLAGFGMEAIADLQKSRFRADSSNRGKFIRAGLWSWSRHPNYFGEITLWTGVAIIAFPVLQGWQLVTLISPVFVFLLLTRVSGIPLLEKKADSKWGGQQDYEDYKAKTSLLVPLPPRN